jgi:hypothetical protein
VRPPLLPQVSDGMVLLENEGLQRVCSRLLGNARPALKVWGGAQPGVLQAAAWHVRAARQPRPGLSHRWPGARSC